MTLAILKERIAEIKRCDYERWAFDPRIDRAVVVAALIKEVRMVAWQSWVTQEVFDLLETLDREEIQ